jgi:hypothetical protein
LIRVTDSDEKCLFLKHTLKSKEAVWRLDKTSMYLSSVVLVNQFSKKGESSVSVV